MSNTITAYFKGRVGVAESVYQNDYGIVMAFDSIDLPAHFDCYFSRLNQEEALPGLGADNRVTIPNSILANPGNVTIHIPLHTGEDDSEVEYVIYFKVIGRARPIDDGTPAQMTAIERALALLSQPITNIEEIVNEALSFTGDTFDEMKAELQEDFDNYTETLEGDLATWKGGVESDIDDVEHDFTVLQNQFDTAVAAVSTDTELTDIRVGDDEVTYTTAGLAVRTQFANLKSEISEYNAYDILRRNGSFSNGTSKTVTYTWNADKTQCEVNGTATGGFSSNNIFNGNSGSIKIPHGMIPGKTYYIVFETTNSNIKLDIVTYKNNATLGGVDKYFEESGRFTVDLECTSLVIRLYVATGNLGTGNVNKIGIVNALSNKELEDNLLSNVFAEDVDSLANTICENALVLNNDYYHYSGDCIYEVREGESVAGISRNYAPPLFPKANQGVLMPSNAPQRFLNSIIKSYMGTDNLIYGNDETLFSPTCDNEIDCSSFVTAVLYGINYNKSRYADGYNSNVMDYYNGENLFAINNNQYIRILSYIMARYYALRKRLFELPTDDAKKAVAMLEYGDIIFTKGGASTAERYYGIGHVMLVIGKIPETNTIIVAQAGSGPSDYKICDNENEVVKTSAFTLNGASLADAFCVFARPCYSNMAEYRIDNVLDGNDLQINTYSNRGAMQSSTTWSATPDYIPVKPSTKIMLNSRSSDLPIVSIQEFDENRIYISAVEIEEEEIITLSASTKFIKINYGYSNISGNHIAFSKLFDFEMKYNIN